MTSVMYHKILNYYVIRIREHCPELLELSVTSTLFTPREPSAESNPIRMAQNFGVPYLGRLPMDPNMMKACEEGYSFAEMFPQSVAIAPFNKIIDKIMDVTESNSLSTLEESNNSNDV